MYVKVHLWRDLKDEKDSIKFRRSPQDFHTAVSKETLFSGAEQGKNPVDPVILSNIFLVDTLFSQFSQSHLLRPEILQTWRQHDLPYR